MYITVIDRMVDDSVAAVSSAVYLYMMMKKNSCRMYTHVRKQLIYQKSVLSTDSTEYIYYKSSIIIVLIWLIHCLLFINNVCRGASQSDI
jgi:hypothetical protein